MPRAFRLSAALALGAAAVLAGPASAQLNPSAQQPETSLRGPDSLMDGAAHERHSQLAAFGVYAWTLGYGIAGRFALPILKDGLLPELNESIELELGGDFIISTLGISFSVLAATAEPRWTFHFTPQLDGYFKLGVGVFILAPPGIGLVAPLAAVGGQYRLGPNLVIRAEAGNFGLALGAGLEF